MNQGIRSWSRDVHAWKVRASDRKGEVQELVSRLTEIFQKRERPDGTKDVPLTSEVRQQTSHYLEKKAMCEQIAGLPKSVKKTWEGANEVLKLSICKTHVCLVEKTTVEDLQKRVLMKAFGRTQEDDGQRLRAGAKGEVIEDFQKRAQLHSSVAWRMAVACDEYDEAENVEHAHCEQRKANTILQEIEEKNVASRYGV